MSQHERDDYVKFRRVTKSFMTICGLWHYKSTNLFYRLIPYKQIAVSITLALSVLKFVWEHHSNLSLVVRGLNIATSFVFAGFKVTCFILNKEDLKNLQNALDPYLDEMLEDSKISKYILKNVNTFKSISLAYTVFIIFTTLLYLSIPIFTIIYVNYHHINVTHYPLIYPTSFFWERPGKGFYYQLHFLFEFTAASTLLALSISVDTMFMLYVFQLVGQLRKISYYVTYSDYQSDNTLSTYVSQYVKLIKYKDSFEKTYGPIILIVLGTNAVVLCTLLFQITHVSGFSGKSIIQGVSFFSYFMAKSIQTFVYAWSGSCLIEESEKCQYAVYNCNWYGNRKLMSSIVIILSQRPLVLTACNFSIVNVRIFVMVLNTSLSYFFLLQTIEEHD